MENYSYVMYFGRSIKGLHRVSLLAFEHFLDDSVVSKFPGYTVTEARGYWNGEMEQTFVMEVFGNDYDEDKCKQICREYCREFDQDCVALKCTAIDPVEFVSKDKK